MIFVVWEPWGSRSFQKLYGSSRELSQSVQSYNAVTIGSVVFGFSLIENEVCESERLSVGAHRTKSMFPASRGPARLILGHIFLQFLRCSKRWWVSFENRSCESYLLVQCYVRWEWLPRLCNRISYRTGRFKLEIFFGFALSFVWLEGIGGAYCSTPCGLCYGVLFKTE